MKFCIVSTCLLFLGLGQQLFAQTIPVGLFNGVEDAYRRQQLLGNDQSNRSYMIRPLYITEFDQLSKEEERDNGAISLTDYRKEINLGIFPEFLQKIRPRGFKMYALPVVWQQQYNSHHPYGMNDGSMIQAKGYQTQISAGIYAKLGPFSMQFRPEFVYSRNEFFTILQESNTAKEFKTSELIILNRIDNPERMGVQKYKDISLGQSSINLTFDPISLGLSNENLWWGPGVRNALLMTNNAAGFKHLTLHTVRPVDIYIGHLEGQLIAGKLYRSNISNILSELVPKVNDWRYINGIAISYQPKWVPNLFVGFDHSFVVYNHAMGKSFSDYLPVFSASEKPNYPDLKGYVNGQDAKERDQYISYFLRYVLPASKAEVYFQWGRNDRAFNTRNLATKPDHTRAYIFGFRKLIPLRTDAEFIMFETEVTQLAKPPSEDKFNNGESWYTHAQVRDGYTHLGQVLGAGIGPGSNMQSFDVSWVKGLKKIGFGMERIDQNSDLYYQSGTTDPRRHWIDLGFNGKFNWNFNKLVLNTTVNYTHSFNYHYGLIQQKGTGAWDWEQQDVNNVHVKLGLLYHF
ncbi:capsule assembly Wzi family protein [Pedobacter sp.]|uniref:capsule assembly Wzi family protein n=1 Tax=Pedobacter sp. TaxID=1411316 RepID=UPI003D7F7DB8